MATSHIEPKDNSVNYSANKLRIEEEVEDADDREETAVVPLFEALMGVNKQAIEAILQKYPGLVDFAYETKEMCHGTPLQIICSQYDYRTYDNQDTGMFVLTQIIYLISFM